MCCFGEESKKTLLPNSPSYCLGKLICSQKCVPREGESVFQIQMLQLLAESFFVNSDAHGRKFDVSVHDIAPDQDVAVEIPVIVIRRSLIM